ncbi:MAG: winged helix-turn-helix domain-containing protein [Bryobacterales bacterium]|nr:winged helix-turn-helix domain-containing protein [Bryobacterales bacterium]
MSDGALDIQLLGSFRVHVDGTAIDESGWGRKKAKTLLKLLAISPNHELHRDQVIEHLWPDQDPESAQNNLHKTIHAARRALEPGLKEGPASRFLLAQDQRVALRAPAGIRIDAIEFERTASAALGSGDPAAMEAAIRAYKGELLPEDRYEDWCALLRERVVQLHRELLWQLSSKKAPEEAAEILQRLTAADPCNENAHRRLMKLYATTGRRHLAISQFRACQDALRKELDADVEPATQRLYERILDGSYSPATATDPLLPRPVLERHIAAAEIAEPAGPEAGESRTETATLASAAAVAEPEAAAAVSPPGQVQPGPPRKILFVALAISLFTVLLAVTVTLISKRPGKQSITSLAVLPFTSNSDVEFMADGLTENLIHSLSALPGIRVMARSTVFTYKGTTVDPREAGKRIGVEAVVTGRIQQQGKKFAVSAELVDVKDGAQIWGQRYEVEDSRLSFAEARISVEVASALQLKLQGDQQQRLVRIDHTSGPAYRSYLMGRYHWNKRTREGFLKSVESFEEAVRADPAFVLAYTGLADAYGLLGFSYGRPKEYFPKAQAMVAKALALDPRSAEAHTSQAMIHALYTWDWPAAEASFRRAIENNQGHATAHHWYGVHLNAMKQHEEAIRELKRAQELDPLSRIINTNLAYPYQYTGQIAKAIEIYRKVLDLDPNFLIAREDLASALELDKRTEEAFPQLVKALELAGEAQLASQVRLLGAARYTAGLKLYRDTLVDRARAAFVPPMQIAQLSARIGDVDTCMQWMERAYEERDSQLVYIGVDPVYQPLRSDARFRGLLARMNLK